MTEKIVLIINGEKRQEIQQNEPVMSIQVRINEMVVSWEA
jgi:hypothetical protein